VSRFDNALLWLGVLKEWESLQFLAVLTARIPSIHTLIYRYRVTRFILTFSSL
jgi:hypothetical protein